MGKVTLLLAPQPSPPAERKRPHHSQASEAVHFVEVHKVAPMKRFSRQFRKPVHFGGHMSGVGEAHV